MGPSFRRQEEEDPEGGQEGAQHQAECDRLVVGAVAEFPVGDELVGVVVVGNATARKDTPSKFLKPLIVVRGSRGGGVMKAARGWLNIWFKYGILVAFPRSSTETEQSL